MDESVDYFTRMARMNNAAQTVGGVEEYVESDPEIDAERFVFTPPEGATRIDQIPVNEMGELTPKEDQ